MQHGQNAFLILGLMTCAGLPAWAQEAPKVPTMASLAEHARVLAEAEKGDPTAAYLVGEAYLEGKKVAKDTALAQKWLLIASEAGIPMASNKLAWMYVQGNGVAANPSMAVTWFKTAAEQGDREALYQLGWMYEHGRGVPKDHATAADWFRRGADAGDEDSMASLGWLLENGLGVEKSPSSAAALYEKAAQEGSAMAMTNLAWLMIEGRGVQKNIPKAVELIQDAARRGHPRGEGSLAYLYENGLGLEKDLGLALDWWDKSAQHGDLKSIRHLARTFFLGQQRPRDEKKALSYALLGAKSAQDPRCFEILSQILLSMKPGAVAGLEEIRSAADAAARDRVDEALPVLIWCQLQVAGPSTPDPELDRLFDRALRVPSCRPSLFMLARSIDLGFGGIVDKARANAWDAALAANGYAPAKITVAKRQLLGETSEKAKGFNSLLSLAEGGDAAAAFELGRAHEEGLGTQRSLEEALRWYLVSVDRNFPGAFLEVARALHSGRLGKKDLQGAARLYRRVQSMGLPLFPIPFKADGSLEDWEKVAVPSLSHQRDTKTTTSKEVVHSSIVILPIPPNTGTPSKPPETPKSP